MPHKNPSRRAIGGLLLGSVLVNAANENRERLLGSLLNPADPADYSYAEWLLAVCLTPSGIWLGLLAGGRRAK